MRLVDGLCALLRTYTGSWVGVQNAYMRVKTTKITEYRTTAVVETRNIGVAEILGHSRRKRASLKL